MTLLNIDSGDRVAYCRCDLLLCCYPSVLTLELAGTSVFLLASRDLSPYSILACLRVTMVDVIVA